MAQIEIKDLTFWYPGAIEESLKNINMKIEQGEFVLVCGKSGCGKTTLLRSIKNTIAPYGKRLGTVEFEGLNIYEMSQRSEAAKIGFVFQQPAHQLVTDKVWHELAFGLENLAFNKDEIKLRVAEVADYFGFADKLYVDVEKLSGGQKQLLNIASIMVMQPEVVLLDEPTAQLDPIAADHLLSTIYKINRDFGTTIIMSEHRLSGILSMADKMFVMDKGSVVESGEPKKVAMSLKETDFFEAMPEAVKIYETFEEDYNKCPITVGEARRWLAEYDYKEKVYEYFEKLENTDELKVAECSALNISPSNSTTIKGCNKNKTTALQCKDVWFRYERNTEDIVKGLSVNVDKSEIFGIVGGNGAGKSTILSVLCGVLKPYRGKVKVSEKVAMLSQDVTCLFLKDTVKEELESGIKDSNDTFLQSVINQMELQEMLDHHPYDLSGGEQQRLGIAKLMLVKPEIILLDEPTKGMDETFKTFFGKLLKEWKNQGKTVVIVSHDIEFLYKYADRCGMFFEGEIISIDRTKEFFKGNRYYTTEREKILRR